MSPPVPTTFTNIVVLQNAESIVYVLSIILSIKYYQCLVSVFPSMLKNRYLYHFYHAKIL